MGKMIIKQLSVKVTSNRFNRLHCSKWVGCIELSCDILVVKVKLNILYLPCRVFISVSKGTKVVKIDQETQEL